MKLWPLAAVLLAAYAGVIAAKKGWVPGWLPTP